MSPLATMAVSLSIGLVGTATTVVSGATFKRAFDQWHTQRQAASAHATVLPAKADTKAASSQHPKKSNTVQVNSVKSEGQSGGVTAGYVENVDQTHRPR